MGVDDRSLGPVKEVSGRWSRHRYVGLSAVVFVLAGIQTLNGQWSSDMWFHVAAVRELIAHPFSPSNPAVLSGAAHPDFGPYSVVLGFIGNVTGLSAVEVLSIAAMANLVLLLVALRVFVLRFTNNARAPFWTLLFVLALWGPRPYRFSGFFGLNSIGFVLPYPSTFATGIALLVLAGSLALIRAPSWGRAVAVGIGTAVVALTHPITGAWLAVGLVVVVACCVRHRDALVMLIAAGVAAVTLILIWPYFWIVDVLRSGGDYSSSNLDMYRLVVVRLLPVALFGLWGLWGRFRMSRADPLVWMLAGGLALYVWGKVGDNSTYGRSLAFVALLLAVAAGDKIGRFEVGWSWSASTLRQRAVAFGLVGVLLIGLVMTRGGLVRMVPPDILPASIRDSSELKRLDDSYAFLSETVGRRDVVVGMSRTDNLMVAAIAGRTLQPGFVDPLVGDVPERDRAQEAFLDVDLPASERASIVERYRVKFVLLDRDDIRTAKLTKALLVSGMFIAYEDQDFRLLKGSP